MSDRRIILKYPLIVDGPTRIPWEPGISRVLTVAAQRPSDSLPMLWVEQPFRYVDGVLHFSGERLFDFLATGQPYDAAEIGEHVGTALCLDGSRVWHVVGQLT